MTKSQINQEQCVSSMKDIRINMLVILVRLTIYVFHSVYKKGVNTLDKNELVECFKKNICKYCTGECNKGMTFTEDGAKCVDYVRKREQE